MNKNKNKFLLLMALLSFVFPSIVRAAMTSQNYTVDSGRVGGEASLSHAASTNYSVDASNSGLDLTAPITNANPLGGTYGAARNITLTCDDASGLGCDKIYYTTDGSTPTTSSSQYMIPINISIDTTLKFFAEDLAGNSEIIKTEMYVIDTTFPVTDIIANPDSLSYATSASFVFVSNKPNGTFECKLDSGNFAGCTTPENYSALTDGSHTFAVRVTDALGHVEPSPATFTWMIDSTAPDTIITDNPTTRTNKTDAMFQFFATESNSTFECQLDNNPVTSCASSKGYTGLAVGAHTFSVTASDQAGNTDTTPAIFNFTIDLTAPVLNITAPNVNAKTNGTQAVSFTDSESTNPQCSIDNSTWTNCVSGTTKISDISNFATIPEGEFTLHLKDIDQAGNVGTVDQIFIKDITPPILTNGNPTNQTFPMTTTSVNLSLDSNDSATCKFSTSPNADFGAMTFFENTNSTSHATLMTGLKPGTTYTYFVRCADVAANATINDLSLTFKIDPLPPVVTTIGKVKIQVGRDINVFKDTIHIASEKFKLKGQDNALANGTVKIYKNGSLWKTVSADADGAWRQTLKIGNDTSKKISVLFYDTLGNLIGSQSAKVSVDSQAPKFKSFITPFYSIRKGNILYWEAKDNQNLDHFKVTFNGKIKTVKKARFTVPADTPNGTYSITVKAYDKVGNTTTKKTWVRVR